MGIMLFFILLACEIGLAVYSLSTKSIQTRVRSSARLSALLGFVGLAALSVIEWGLRYYSLLALLTILASFSAVTLLKGGVNRPYKPMRVVINTLVMSLLLLIAAVPVIVFPEYQALAPTGEYKVLSSSFTYIDSNRIETYTNTGEHRRLNVGLWYPQDVNDKLPLIVFSHGSLGVKSSNLSLYNELASHGYVVCSIDHTYQCFYTTNNDGRTILIDRGYMQECFREDPRRDIQQSLEYYQKWMNIRTQDISFVIDTILAESVKSEASYVYQLVDSNKIGVMGHSLGGSAALGIGRLREDISAVIALEAPYMCDITGVQDNEFVFLDQPYPVPVLNVYSDDTWGILSQRVQYRTNHAMLTDGNDTNYNVHLSGVGHFNLTDLSLTSPLLTKMLNMSKQEIPTEQCLREINKICLQFFDSYLKGVGKFSGADSSD